MVKLLAILARARVLHGALGSTTTRGQWYVTIPVAVLVSALGAAVPALAGEPVALAAATVLVAVAGPLVSRLARYAPPANLPHADVFLFGVNSRREPLVWHAFQGTVLDAHEEGWDFGKDSDGNLYDLRTGRCEGVVMREAGEHLRGLQGADSTANAPDLGVYADNTDTE